MLLATTSGSVSALTVWFYVLSIVAMAAGMVGGAIRFAVAWGRARAMWEAQLEVTKELRSQLDHVQETLDARMATAETRITVLEAVR